MLLRLLPLLIAFVQPAPDRFLVVVGADSIAYAVSDTIEIRVGEVAEIVPQLHSADGALRPRGELWVHNTSPELVDFEEHVGRDRYSADPIRVTPYGRGLAPVLIHWSMEGGGAVWLHLLARPTGSPRPAPPRSPDRL